ncbi:MAG: CRISPR-associated helicase Cas3' [Clostridia bacterium]|nr:CRISPR-associated helicase Cas3' [Clostridia bacterium]
METTWLWAKSEPYYSLSCHMLDVGFCAQAIFLHGSFKSTLRQWAVTIETSEEQALALIGYFSALHDWGKAHPFFQLKWRQMPYKDQLVRLGLLGSVSESTCESFRHEQYSKVLLRKLLMKNGISGYMLDVLPDIVGLHHQGKMEINIDTTIPKRMHRDSWEKLQNELEKYIRETYQPDFSALNHDCKDISFFSTIMLGTIILADWVCSSMRKEKEPQPSLDLAKSWLEECGLIPGLLIPETKQLNNLFHWMDQSSLRGIQRCAEELPYEELALMIIEAPMGEGKTETALFAANSICHYQKKDGFYIALPTTATGNQMYHRVNELFASHKLGKVRLLHGNAWMVEMAQQCKTGDEDEDREQRSQWLSPLRKGLLSQFAVGTIDQAMMAVLDAKYSILRLMGLLDKVLIIDEIHAYDTYMYEIIQRLLLWCKALRIPVIMLSATLPDEKKISFLQGTKTSREIRVRNEYPLITTVSWNGDICQTNVSGKPAIQRDYHINIECIGNDYSAIASLVMQRVHHGGCICVLMNTVNRAQQVYLELKNHIDPNTKLLLFHARYPAETRQDIEDQCTFLFGKEAGANRPRRAILVCTQVMEQSLDVDFDSMITDLAPIDLLLQRMGRVHRFSKTIRPSDLLKPFITIIAGKNAEEDCDNDSIYAPLFLRRTLRLLQQKENIQVPEEMRQLTNTVYSGLLGNQEEISRWTKQKFMDSQFATAAQMELWGEPDTRSVFFSEQAGHFRLEEEERPFCQRAKTRLTDDSIRMVFVTAEEMGRFRQDFLGGVYDKTFAQSVLKRAFSIRLPAKWDIGNLPKGVYRGTGLLCGVFLLESENESFEWDTLRIWNDSDLGIRQERRR